MDKLGVEFEVNSIGSKIQLIKRVFKFLRLIALDSMEGKNYLRGLGSRNSHGLGLASDLHLAGQTSGVPHLD